MSKHPPIPVLNLERQHTEIRSEIDAALRRVVDSHRFVLGPEVEAFEAEFAAFSESRFAVSCASGSDALLLSLMVLGIGPGDVVLTPAFGFVASATSISRLGATPLFCDLDPATYNVDPDDVRRKALRTKGVKALIGVDLFGQICDLEALRGVGKDLGLPVVQDCAQAVGARDAFGRRAGSGADLGCFSLYPTKNLGALGDGGVIATDDADLAARLQSLRVHGAEGRYVHSALGINSRLDALQAAVLRAKLPHLERWNDRRRTIAADYDDRFAAAGAVPTDKPFSAATLPLRTPRPPGGVAEHVYHHYTVRVPAHLRDPLRARLAARGIGSEIYYPLGLHEQPCFPRRGPEPDELPETDLATTEALSLPVHPHLRDDERSRVADAVIEALESYRAEP